MSAGRPPPGSIPTLTEIVPWPTATKPPAKAELDREPEPALAASPHSPGEPEPPLDEAQLVQRVLADIDRQIDLMLEVRLREALAPALARAADALVRDARKELTSALHYVVSRSVARELGKPE